jgi:hypothetical protein
MISETSGPHSVGEKGVPHWVDLHPSFECGSSDAPSSLFIGGQFSMENPTTWFY